MELIYRTLLHGRSPLRKEFAGITVILLIFIFFPYFVRQIDVTAAAIDPGIFSAIILAISAVLIFQAVTWWVIRIIWPVFATYSTFQFENNFKSLQSWQKVLIYLGFYLSVLYSFVAVLRAFV